MSQDDFIIANQGFPAFRSDLNANLQALASTSSGATAPSTTYANQLWYDTANDILKIRNEANSAWINVITLDQTNSKNSSITVPTIDSGTSTALTLKSGGTTAATIDTNQNINAVNTVVMSSPYTMRNKIINGAMVIDQRNAGASVTPTYDTFYNIDRWSAHLSQSSKFSVQQVSDGPSGFQKSLKVTSLSAYSVLAADYFTIEQVVEGFNGADLAWGTASALTVTLSFWVKSSLTGTFGGAFVNYSAGSYANTFSYTINAANTWEYKTVTVTGATGSSWNSTNSGFLSLCFTIGAGSNYQTAAGSWGSVTGRTVPSAVNVVSTNGATWQVTGVQLELGTAATPFEYRNYQQELAMCQRYFQKSYNLGTAVGSVTSGGRTYFILGTDATARNKGGAAYFRVSMRASPTVTMYNESGATGAFSSPAVTANFVGISTELFNVYAASVTNTEVYGSWTASAEL